jgi:hypothetical protein
MTVYTKILTRPVSITLLLQMPQEIFSNVKHVSAIALSSFKTLLSQTPESPLKHLSAAQGWADAVFRILGLGQIAMIALAFRARIKRH